MINKEKAGTFILNKKEPIHGWYSYIEGYSSCLVQDELDELIKAGNQITTIYDPFGGTGTTPLVAAHRGIASYCSESNPFMQFVLNTKINGVRSYIENNDITTLKLYIEKVHQLKIQHYNTWDGFEKFFDLEQLNTILSLKGLFEQEVDVITRDILMLVLSSILVKSSKMIRRGDLRYATEREYHPENVTKLFIDKLNEIIIDIEEDGKNILAPTTLISEDARENTKQNLFDCVITSPPYLNGTNYIRNTKLELKLNNFIITEKELPQFHSKGIIAGINNVSKRSGKRPILAEVEPYMEQLLQNPYDERIPKMVVGYFYDMNDVISRLHDSMRNGGYFIMDIGDSQFGGVHIPTHDILSALCEQHGFIKYKEEILRERRSKNGMVLSQRLLKYRLEK